VTQLT
jgi:hypothetical protein